jgi:hypothetical protein
MVHRSIHLKQIQTLPRSIVILEGKNRLFNKCFYKENTSQKKQKVEVVLSQDYQVGQASLIQCQIIQWKTPPKDLTFTLENLEKTQVIKEEEI